MVSVWSDSKSACQQFVPLSNPFGLDADPSPSGRNKKHRSTLPKMRSEYEAWTMPSWCGTATPRRRAGLGHGNGATFALDNHIGLQWAAMGEINCFLAMKRKSQGVYAF